MASEKRILRSEHGVTLTEVTLRSGSAIAAVAYVVQNRRTPEAPNFSNLALAEAAFREEIKRCTGTDC
jgi:hypothetical protein